MTTFAAPGAATEIAFAGLDPSLGSAVGVRVVDGQGATTIARTTSGIVESPAASGVYIATVTAPATRGTYHVVLDDGAGTFRVESLEVTSSALGPGPTGSDLTTLAAVRADLEISATASDSLITSMITVASAVIMEGWEREFAPATDALTRRFRVEDHVVDLAPYDLRSATGVTLHPEDSSPRVLTSDEYALDPIPSRHGVYTAIEISREVVIGTSAFWRRFGHAQLEVAGDWGFAAVPRGVQQACVETVQSWLRNDPSGWQEMVPTDGRQIAPRPQGTYAIPGSALRMLNPFRRYVSVA